MPLFYSQTKQSGKSRVDAFRNSNLRGMHTENITPGQPRDAEYMQLFARTRSNITRKFATVRRSGLGQPYVLNESFYTTLEADLASAAAIGCQVVLVLTPSRDSTPNPIDEATDAAFWDSPTERAFHIDICRQFAARMRGDDRIAAVSCLNEPWHPVLATAQSFTDTVIAHQEAVNAAMLAEDPDIVFMAVCAWFNPPGGYTQMRPLIQDNVVYEVHHYAPYEITHANVAGQPAYTENGQPGQYPSVTARPVDVANGAGFTGPMVANADRMENVDLYPYLEFIHKYNVPGFIGEFTCTMMNADGVAPRWVEDSIKIFEKHGISWCQFGFWFAPNPWDANKPANSPVLIDFDDGTDSGQRALNTFTSGSTSARTPYAVVTQYTSRNKMYKQLNSALNKRILTLVENFEGPLTRLGNSPVVDTGTTVINNATSNPKSGTRHALISQNATGAKNAFFIIEDNGQGRTCEEYFFSADFMLGQAISPSSTLTLVEANTNGEGSGSYWRLQNIPGTNNWQVEIWSGSGDYGNRPFLNVSGMSLPVGEYTNISVAIRRGIGVGRVRVWQDDKLLIDCNHIPTSSNSLDYHWRIIYGMINSNQNGQTLAIDNAKWIGFN